MSKITTAITPQRFELIAPQIYSILKDELANQFTLTNEAVLDATVLLERSTPPNQDEYPLVSVRYNGSSSLSKSQDGDQLLNNVYAIDCYVAASSSSTSTADSTASLAVARLIGVIREILLNPLYAQLDFPGSEGIVRSVTASAINMTEPSNNQDALTVTYGQLVVNVETNESSEQISPVLIQKFVTAVKLNESEDGFIWNGETLGENNAFNYYFPANL
mgnify:FL=1|tara:strand:- start:3362 stop:4018 length:657 start_codon:yes stop_codon:yes gene_type:complete